MMTEILFLAHNRLAFTEASMEALISNTDWNRVSKLWIYDDWSVDGTREYLTNRDVRGIRYPIQPEFVLPPYDNAFGGPVAVMKDFLIRSSAALFVKIDNDVIVPPSWLEAGLQVMEHHPELDLLGIEPPASRTPHFRGGRHSPVPEVSGLHVRTCDDAYGYVECDSIGGIGFMRTAPLNKYRDLRQHSHSKYSGFTEWQMFHTYVKRGWIVPPLNVFLLDRLPIKPWRDISQSYIESKWQREWTAYPESRSALWNWWWEKTPCQQKSTASHS